MPGIISAIIILIGKVLTTLDEANLKSIPLTLYSRRGESENEGAPRLFFVFYPGTCIKGWMCDI